MFKWKINGLKIGITGQKEIWSETDEVEPYDNNYVAR
jgi:hypothetical protein